MTSGQSELGRTSCSRVPRRWSACPRRRIPLFRNRWGYCCTNARVERSFMSEGLAGTRSCCCSCCRSTISVGEAWSGRVPSDSLGAFGSRQLRYTVPVPPDSSSTLSPSQCVTLLLPILLTSARICRGTGWGVREAGWKHEWRVTSQRLLQHNFYLHQPGNISPEMNTWTPAATANKRPASAGTLGEKGRCQPSAQVLTL